MRPLTRWLEGRVQGLRFYADRVELQRPRGHWTLARTARREATWAFGAGVVLARAPLHIELSVDLGPRGESLCLVRVDRDPGPSSPSRDHGNPFVARILRAGLGRPTLPTPAERAAHARNGGTWLVQRRDGAMASYGANLDELAPDEVARVWAVDSAVNPCVWPTVSPEEP